MQESERMQESEGMQDTGQMQDSGQIQDYVRIFAYSTWVMMVSSAIILTANFFLIWVDAPGWPGWITLLVLGVAYANLIYSAVRRFIRKVPAPTRQYLLIAVFTLLPALVWVHGFSAVSSVASWKTTVALAAGVAVGLRFGHPAGVKARFEYVQQIKERYRKMEKKG